MAKSAALDMSADPDKFDEACGDFAARRVVSRAEADALSGYARKRAWWISGVAQLDVVNDAHRSLLAAISDGTTFEDWKKAIGPKLKAAWGRANSPRILTIFRNATTSAYNAGRWQQMTQPHVKALRPYVEYDVVDDTRTSRICKPLRGVVLPIDDTFVLTHNPPLHHMCRTGLVSQRRSVAESKGITEQRPDIKVTPGFGLPPQFTEPPKLTERAEQPAPELVVEGSAKAAKATKRKQVAPPEAVVTEDSDAELFNKFRPIKLLQTDPGYKDQVGVRRAALAKLPETLNRKQAKALLVATGADVPIDVAKAYPRMVAALGDRLHIYEYESRHVQSAVRELMKIRPELAHDVAHSITEEHFEGVWTGQRKLTDFPSFAHLRGVSPRGWEGSGATWDVVGGAGGPRHVAVAIGGRGSSLSIPLHEFGHAIAGRLKKDGANIFESPFLKKIHIQQYDQLDKYLQQGGPGGFAGMSETFAESVAHYHYGTEASFDQRYSREYRTWLKQILEA